MFLTCVNIAFRMVKHKGIVWKYFKEIKHKDNFECRFCSTQFKKNATRQLNHLLKCKKAPDVVKKSLLLPSKAKIQIQNVDSDEDDCSTDNDMEARRNVSVVSTDCTTETEPSISGSSGLQRTNVTNRANLKTYFDSVSAKENAEIDELLARAIYVSGAPLDLTSKKVWKDFFAKIRCAYKPPTRYMLSNPLLNDEYERVKECVNSKIKEASILALQVDAWSNCRNDSISNYVVNTPLPIFYKTVHTKSKHLATFLASEIDKIIQEVGVNRFFAIVTDNGANIKKAREIISNKYKHIINYGCICHAFNLLVQDILKLERLNEFKKTVTSTASEIKNSHLLHATFEKIQLDKQNKYISLKMPVKTRWLSFIECLKSFLNTKYALQILAVDPDAIITLKKTTKNCLLDDSFWEQISIMYHILKPIGTWIKYFEANAATISKVFDAFLEIEVAISRQLLSTSILQDEQDTIKTILMSRMNKSIKPIHLAANLLEPANRGRHLSPEQNLIATEFIFEIAKSHPRHNDSENIITELAEYKVRSGFFAKEFVISSEKLNGVTWWSGICSSKNLSSLASDILNLPASTAATERTFSTQGFIHSQRRNRLTVVRAGQEEESAEENMDDNDTVESGGDTDDNFVRDGDEYEDSLLLSALIEK